MHQSLEERVTVPSGTNKSATSPGPSAVSITCGLICEYRDHCESTHFATIRKQQSCQERAQILAEDNLITLDDRPDALQVMAPAAKVSSADPFNLSEVERRTARAALEQVKGNKVQAAKLLGISRRALYRLVTEYGLEEGQAEVVVESK